jgi:hypothetical protein
LQDLSATGILSQINGFAAYRGDVMGFKRWGKAALIGTAALFSLIHWDAPAIAGGPPEGRAPTATS